MPNETDQKHTITFVDFGSTVEASPGETLLEAAASAGVELAAPCGGMGLCGKCRVHTEGALTPPAAAELALLSGDELASGVRLACSCRPVGPVNVRVPDAALATPRIDDAPEGPPPRPVAPDPDTRRFSLDLTPPSLVDPASDLTRLMRALPRDVQPPDTDIIRKLPALLRSNSFRVQAVVSDSTVLDVEPSGAAAPLCGLAVDVGTTSLAAALIDLETGERLGTVVSPNPQRVFGADVLTRLTRIIEYDDGPSALQRLVVKRIGLMARTMCERRGIDPACIREASIAGNPVMCHILLGVDPRHIGPMPFTPVFTGTVSVRARDIGLGIDPAAAVRVLPGVSGYVGADTVAGLLAVNFGEGGPRLFVDVGTNAEIVVSDGRGGLVACSAAAGPALEGARISQGMTAAPGAIDRVDIDGDIAFTVIGGVSPKGFCGTGVIDTVAALCTSELIEPSGRLARPDSFAGPDALRSRLVSSATGVAAFRIADPPSPGVPILFTQRDVREVQLAKAAVRAGIDILLEKAKVRPEDLIEIVLAGALGTALRRESAERIWLIPRIPGGVRFAGNTALEGAAAFLVSRAERRRAVETAARIHYVEISTRPDFQDRFAECIGFEG